MYYVESPSGTEVGAGIRLYMCWWKKTCTYCFKMHVYTGPKVHTITSAHCVSGKDTAEGPELCDKVGVLPPQHRHHSFLS